MEVTPDGIHAMLPRLPPSMPALAGHTRRRRNISADVLEQSIHESNHRAYGG